MELGLLIIRLVVGLTLAAHGAQKLFGWFGGYGLKGTGGFMSQLGFRHGTFFAGLAGLGELGGGLMLAVGLLTPIAAGIVAATMAVAIATFHSGKGFFADKGGGEFAIALGVVAIGLAFTGAGSLSLDAALGLDLFGLTWGMIAFGIAFAGLIFALVGRSLGEREAAT